MQVVDNGPELRFGKVADDGHPGSGVLAHGVSDIIADLPETKPARDRGEVGAHPAAVAVDAMTFEAARLGKEGLAVPDAGGQQRTEEKGGMPAWQAARERIFHYGLQKAGCVPPLYINNVALGKKKICRLPGRWKRSQE